jgi:hypothetical protein
MIDGKRYLSSKPKGLGIIIEKDNVFYIRYKRFDVRDGSEAEPEYQEINIKDILDRKDLLEQELNGINEVFLDLEILKNQTDNV